MLEPTLFLVYIYDLRTQLPVGVAIAYAYNTTSLAKGNIAISAATALQSLIGAVNFLLKTNLYDLLRYNFVIKVYINNHTNYQYNFMFITKK